MKTIVCVWATRLGGRRPPSFGLSFANYSFGTGRSCLTIAVSTASTTPAVVASTSTSDLTSTAVAVVMTFFVVSHRVEHGGTVEVVLKIFGFPS